MIYWYQEVLLKNVEKRQKEEKVIKFSQMIRIFKNLKMILKKMRLFMDSNCKEITLCYHLNSIKSWNTKPINKKLRGN